MTFEPSPWDGWHQLALVLEPRVTGQSPEERRRSLRVLLADCRALSRQRRAERRRRHH
jgi:hypothetical protein